MINTDKTKWPSLFGLGVETQVLQNRPTTTVYTTQPVGKVSTHFSWGGEARNGKGREGRGRVERKGAVLCFDTAADTLLQHARTRLEAFCIASTLRDVTKHKHCR